MATSGTSLKIKRFRQHFGISAPKLAIRTQVAWYWRALKIIAILSLSLAISAWVYDAGRRIAGFNSDESVREIQALRNHVMDLDTELGKLRSLAETGNNSLQIERTTLKQLTQQTKLLEAENAALKEDLAFFESLIPSTETADAAGVRIENLRAIPIGEAGEYRYQMLLVNKQKVFKGSLQLQIKVQQNGKDAMIFLPDEAEKPPQRFDVEFKSFHRVEGKFSLPKGAAIKEIEARLLQDGKVRSKQVITL